MAQQSWTTKEFNEAVADHYKDMKKEGFTKSDCVRDIKQLMKDNNIVIKNKK